MGSFGKNLFFIIAVAHSTSAFAYDADYDRLFPFYIEYAAGTQLAPLRGETGGMGGHAVAYIRGLCKDYSVSFPRVKVCDPKETPPSPTTELEFQSTEILKM